MFLLERRFDSFATFEVVASLAGQGSNEPGKDTIFHQREAPKPEIDKKLLKENVRD